MKNRKHISTAIFLALLFAANITAFAKEEKNVYMTETSRYSVEYGQQVEKDRQDQCEVYIAVPWEFSSMIPKTPLKTEEYRPVQTGDHSGIEWQVALMILSALGICGVTRKEKRNSI